MAKFYGNIGFAIDKKTSSTTVWKSEIIEKAYRGDIIRSTRRFDAGEGLNDNISISNQISVVSDDLLNSKLGSIRYVVLRGTRWKVTEVEIKPPRIIITIGGVYNGPTPKQA